MFKKKCTIRKNVNYLILVNRSLWGTTTIYVKQYYSKNSVHNTLTCENSSIQNSLFPY